MLTKITNACITQKTHAFNTLAGMVSNRTTISIAEKFLVSGDGKTKQNIPQAIVPHSVSAVSVKFYQIIWKLFKYDLE